MRYRLRTLLIALALGPIMIWCGHRLLSLPMPTQEITTSDEFNSTISSGNVIIHVDVDWALQAQASRTVVERFEQTVAADSRLHGVVVRRIDCSNQGSPVWTSARTWLAARADWRSLLYGGYGAVVWVEDGEVKDSVIDAASIGHDALYARTLAQFTQR